MSYDDRLFKRNEYGSTLDRRHLLIKWTGCDWGNFFLMYLTNYSSALSSWLKRNKHFFLGYWNDYVKIKNREAVRYYARGGCTWPARYHRATCPFEQLSAQLQRTSKVCGPRSTEDFLYKKHWNGLDRSLYDSFWLVTFLYSWLTEVLL